MKKIARHLPGNIFRTVRSLSPAVLAFLVSCSQPRNEETIKSEINQYKKQITELNKQIEVLEQELASSGSDNPGGVKVPVRVRELRQGTFRHFIQVSGTAESVSAAFISPEVSGQLKEIFVEEGDYVNKGELLARLNTEITEASIAEVQSQLDLAIVVFEKQSRLWEKNIGSEMQYLNAKTNKESLEKRLETLQSQLDMAIIKSPVNGVVEEIFLKKGELALPGVQMLQVVNLDEVYINAEVSETYLPHVKEGDTVKLEFPVYPGMAINAPIYRKGSNINPNNRTFTVQLKLSNPQKLLKPNLLSVIHINDFSADSAITVPSIIIKQDLKGSYVYVLDRDGDKSIARKVYIEPGRSYGDETMIIRGLDPGLKVIVEGYNQVTNGSAIEVKTSDLS